MFDFDKTNKYYQTRINSFLTKHLNNQQVNSRKLNQAITYTLLAGGKRIRPLLCYATAEAFEIDKTQVDCIAASLEMIHAYSLIHDDLPAMDDDDLRRGQATCHIKYGEATAILAGDALQALAFEVLTQTPSDAKTVLKLIKKLSVASGINGMVAGQALDLTSENKLLTLIELQKIHQLKTGTLICASVEMVGLLYEKISTKQKQALKDYAYHFGMCFQIIDDVLDVIGDEEILGKPIGSDQSLSKSTYPELLGLEQSKKTALTHAENAIKSLSNLPANTIYLKKLAQYLINRQS